MEASLEMSTWITSMVLAEFGELGLHLGRRLLAALDRPAAQEDVVGLRRPRERLDRLEPRFPSWPP